MILRALFCLFGPKIYYHKVSLLLCCPSSEAAEASQHQPTACPQTVQTASYFTLWESLDLKCWWVCSVRSFAALSGRPVREAIPDLHDKRSTDY